MHMISGVYMQLVKHFSIILRDGTGKSYRIR